MTLFKEYVPMKRLKDSVSLSVSSVMLDTIYGSYTVPYVCLKLNHDIVRLRQVLNKMVADSSRVQSRILNSLYNLASALTKSRSLRQADIGTVFPSYGDFSGEIAAALKINSKPETLSLSDSIKQLSKELATKNSALSGENAELSQQLSRLLSSSSVIQGEVLNHQSNDYLSQEVSSTLNFCVIVLDYLKTKLSPFLLSQFNTAPDLFRYSSERVESLVDYGCRLTMYGERLPSEFILAARNHPDWKAIYLAVSEFMEDTDNKRGLIEMSSGELAIELFSQYTDVKESLIHPIVSSQEFIDLLGGKFYSVPMSHLTTEDNVCDTLT
jgi:hypothetical protein